MARGPNLAHCLFLYGPRAKNVFMFLYGLEKVK